MKTHKLLLFTGLALLLSTTCKKDYYSGTEVVRLNATLNNPSEVLRLGDTLKVILTMPAALTSESGTVTPVRSVQQVLYNFTLYRIDTLTLRGTRIVSSSALFVSKGSFFPGSMSSVLVSTTGVPYQSALNLVPPAKGIYYVQTIKGALKVNNGDYEAFLKVNFDVPSKHWDMYDRYVPGYSTEPSVIQGDNDGYAAYYFRVK